MRRRWVLLGLIAAGVSVNAPFAAGAWGRAKVLALELPETSEPVKPSESWEFGIGTLRFEESSGAQVECRGYFGPNQLEGAVVTTGAKVDVIEVKQGYLELKGRVSRPCEESTEGGTERAVYVGLAGFPWNVDLRSNGVATDKNKALLTITTVTTPAGEPGAEAVEACSYQAPKLDAAEVIEGPLAVTLGGVLKRTSPSPRSCPKTVRMVDDGPAFTLASPLGPHSGTSFFFVDAWVR